MEELEEMKNLFLEFLISLSDTGTGNNLTYNCKGKNATVESVLFPGVYANYERKIITSPIPPYVLADFKEGSCNTLRRTYNFTNNMYNMRVSIKNTVLEKYLHIPDDDFILGVYVDYLSFYGDFKVQSWSMFEGMFKSDNDRTIIRDEFTISYHGNYYTYDVVYKGHIVQVGTIKIMSIKGEYMLKVDIKGKGLLVLQKLGKFNEFINQLKTLGLDKITITRIDYAMDLKGNGRIESSPENYPQKTQDFMIRGRVTYRSFGSRTSSVFIRFYDKKLDLYDKGFGRLYPEYMREDEIIRQEVQVNGKGIEKRKTSLNGLINDFFIADIKEGRQGSDIETDEIRSLERALIFLLRRIKKTRSLDGYKIIESFYLRNIKE